MVAIGASTGGPQALTTILDGLPSPLGIPMLLVQHITDGFIDGFVEWLGSRTSMDVVIATHGVSSCARARCTSPAAVIT